MIWIHYHQLITCKLLALSLQTHLLLASHLYFSTTRTLLVIYTSTTSSYIAPNYFSTQSKLISNRLITGGVGSSFYEHLKKYRNIQENNIDEERSYISDLPTGLQRTLDEPRTAFMWVDYVVENMEGYGCLVSLYFSSILVFWFV